MSQPIALTTTGLRAVLEKTSALARRVTLRQVWYEFGWRWLAGAAAFFLLDLIFGLSVPLRWVGLIALAAYPVWTAWRIRKVRSAGRFPEDRSARIVEEGHPEMNNALINAVQFRRIVETADPIQAELMRREIARAEQVAGATPVEDVIDRRGERQARWILFGAAGVWIVGAVLFPNAMLTVLPRMFAPWMDNVTPPFSLTRIDLSPKGASVRYGGSLAVQVSVQGPIPDTLTLVSQPTKGAAADVPMEGTEPGKYTVTLTGLKQDTWIVATGAGTRSGRYLVKVILPPTAETLKATYTYPSFTRRAAETEFVGDKGIHAWENTKVHLSVTANRELSSGELIIESPGADPVRVALSPDPKDARTVSGDFPITVSGKFHVALIGSDQQVNSDAARGKIVVEPDARPSVWFDSPGESIAVTPAMSVTLAVGADDDMGVTQVDLHRVINGIADSRNSLYQGEPQKRLGEQLTMDMADLGVRPGDKITYYADAFDGDPSKPNFAETDPYTIDVVSPEDYNKMLANQRSEEQISREAKEIRDAIQSLAERQQELAKKMEKLAKALQAKPGDPELNRQMAEAKKQQAALQAEAQRTAQQLQDYAKSPSASPIESALKQQVGKAAQSIAQAAQQMSQAQGANPGSAAEAAKKAAATLNKTAGQTEKSVGQTIKNLDKIEPLYQDVNRFMELLDRQGQLVLQARQFEQGGPMDAPDRAKLNDISSEQGKIQDELHALQDDLRRHAADAKADFPKAAASAVRIADEIGRREIPPTMGTAHNDYEQLQGADGFANSKRAFDQMEAMVSTAKAGQGVCKGDLDIALTKTLGQSGLGQGLDGMNPGTGTKPGEGEGSSSGGQMSGGSASQSQGSSSQMVAYTTDLRSLSSGGPSDKKYHQHGPGAEVAISPERIEKMGNDLKIPPKASDSASKGYLPEYRKMIHDYFVSVGKEQKQ